MSLKDRRCGRDCSTIPDAIWLVRGFPPARLRIVIPPERKASSLNMQQLYCRRLTKGNPFAAACACGLVPAISPLKYTTLSEFVSLKTANCLKLMRLSMAL